MASTTFLDSVRSKHPTARCRCRGADSLDPGGSYGHVLGEPSLSDCGLGGPPLSQPFSCALRASPRNSWRGRSFSVVAMLGVVLLCVVQINLYFGLNNTVSDLMGTAVARIQPLESSLKRAVDARPGQAPPSAWKAPPDSMPPRNGVLRRADIPGTVSGFNAREAYVYLPPAYQTASRPSLPVLVLFAGQPGGPADWLTGGQLRSVLDQFAENHHGIAPVTVVVDPNGSANANTMCMDSNIASVDTYLSKDVPAWITQTLDVATDHKQWAVGGFSFGGTCAMQMGTLHPDLFASILPFAAEREPAWPKIEARPLRTRSTATLKPSNPGHLWC